MVTVLCIGEDNKKKERIRNHSTREIHEDLEYLSHLSLQDRWPKRNARMSRCEADDALLKWACSNKLVCVKKSYDIINLCVKTIDIKSQ